MAPPGFGVGSGSPSLRNGFMAPPGFGVGSGSPLDGSRFKSDGAGWNPVAWRRVPRCAREKKHGRRVSPIATSLESRLPARPTSSGRPCSRKSTAECTANASSSARGGGGGGGGCDGGGGGGG
eukprot:3729267-Prymnesium_polylepis.1